MSSSYSGIVSPCSTCKNQRYVSDPSGLANVCPRRVKIAQYLADKQGSPQDSQTADLYSQLALTGTDSDPSLTAPLKNPVYDTNGSSVLVWVALLKDNPAVVDPYSGNKISPPLTDPAYDTNYITCQPLPFTPNSDEHGYFLKGALKEGEAVVVHEALNQYTEDGSQLLAIGGSVDRASYAGSIKRNPVIEDNCPQGT